MDPVSLIVAALAAGASAALKDTAAQVVKDAYAGLKSLLKRKVSAEPLAAGVIDQHEKSPDVWDKPLRQQLDSAGAGDDEKIVRAAQRLLELVDPAGARGGKYNVTISGGKGIVVGDHAHVEMTFENGD